jgi:hypothetical protein
MNRKNRQFDRQNDRQFVPRPPWQTHPNVVLSSHASLRQGAAQQTAGLFAGVFADFSWSWLLPRHRLVLPQPYGCAPSHDRGQERRAR